MPKNKEKIVFFDFCGTLVPFQSAPRYINFVIDKYPRRVALIRRKIRTLLEKLHMLHRLERFSKGIIKRKEIELWPLKGYKIDILNEAADRFYKEVIKPNLIPEIMREYERYQQEDYRVVLVSGGYGIYLRYFAEEHGIDKNDVISSNVQIKQGKATGKLDGLDCMGENKVKLLEKRFDKTKIYAEAYSDSPSDLPLLKWVDRGNFVISIDSSVDEKHIFHVFYKS